MSTRRDQSGFTIIELVLGIVLLVILASVAFLMMRSSDRVSTATNKAKVTAARAYLTQLHQASMRFRMDHERYPTSIEELVSGPAHPIMGDATSYLREVPLDPWTDTAYVMHMDENGRPFFMSYGADQAEGGEGVNQDLYSNVRGEK